MSQLARLRAIWWTLHRWIGLALAVLLVPIAVSGALLVRHDRVDALIHPDRYAVTGSALMSPSAYVASARAAVERDVQWMRWIHEGSHSGAVWQAIVFLTGVFPLVFAVTGVVMWWRGRRGRRLLAEGRAAEVGELQAAE